ncbi:MAG: M50 family metallopeptidase [Tatlockia sp.]|jgi:regulator of sigma E protease
MLKALIAIVLTLILVVGIHEAGHALAALWFGVKIKRVAIGFGKPLVKLHDASNREWVWGLWPLGGYVQLLNSRIEPVSPEDLPACFDKKAVWVRLVILCSGALANALLAYFALTLFYMTGFKHQLPLIKAVSPQSIAASAGLKAKDRILAINNSPIPSWQESGVVLLMSLGKAEVPLQVQDAEGTIRQLNLPLSQWHYKNTDKSLLQALGIEPVPAAQSTVVVKGESFVKASNRAFFKGLQLLYFFMVMIKLLFTGLIPFALLLGPLAFLAASVGSFLQGFVVFMYFIASVSLAVAFTNLLPLPGLDGGSIVFALVEKLRGKPVSIALELLLYRLAFIVFIVLTIQLVMHDLTRYFF